MTSAARLRHTDGVALAAALIGAIAGALIWVLWVLPISRSVADAEPAPIGSVVEVDLDSGQRIGIWGTGRAIWLGSVECDVRAPDGSEVPTHGGPSLRWDDTLWWMTPRDGFEQFAVVTAVDSGVHTVRCRDSVETYDGEFLTAGDTFGGGDIGLGRTGSNDVAIGTIFAFSAVVLPLFCVLLVIVIAVRRLRDRRRAARLS